MHHIIYLSRAAHPMSDEELADLLIQCRSNNERLGITGALVYGDGQFMQIMEGSRATVEALYQKVETDPRHIGVMKLADKEIPHRSFGNWAMAFERTEQLEPLLGYTSPEELRRALPASLSAADSLLYSMMCTINGTE